MVKLATSRAAPGLQARGASKNGGERAAAPSPAKPIAGRISAKVSDCASRCFSFASVAVDPPIVARQQPTQTQTTTGGTQATTGPGQTGGTGASSGPQVTTAAFSIAASQRKPINSWIPDPKGGLLFGLTALPQYTAPEFHVDPAPSGKGVTVRPTHADLQSVIMQFLAPGQYADATLFQWQCDVSVDRSCYPDGSMIKPRVFWDVTQAASDLLAAGEQEHCNDYQFAFYAVLGRAAEIVNALASAATVFPTEAAAKTELLKTVSIDPRDWKKYFECLVIASIKTRDDRPNSWHTPLPPTHPAVRKRSRLVSRGQGQYDAFVAVLSPETGKHSTFDVVNAAAASCNAAAQAQASHQAPASPGRAKPDDVPQKKPDPDEFTDDPLADVGDRSAIRVRPGPVRTTLIRPQRMLDLDGAAFSGKQPDPGAWIQEFLSYFNLWPVLSLGTTERYRFMRAQTPQRDLTLTEAVDKTVEQGLLDGHTLDRQAVIGGILARMPRVPGPVSSTSRVSFYLTFSIVRTGHVDLMTGQVVTPDSPGFQAAAQITWELHKENQSGPEFTWVGQLTTFKDPTAPGQTDSGPFQLQSAYTGFQAAWVFSFLKGSLQIGPLAQALAGFARAQQTVDGVIKLVPAAQIGAGGQILYTVPGFGGHLQIGGQAAAAFTDPSGAHSTIDFAPSIIVQWKLN